MILSSKQLEELENLHDTVSEFDEEANLGGKGEEFDEVAEGALAWRRGMLERAVLNVKKIDKQPLSSKDKHAAGSLIFDPTHHRFARVKSGDAQKTELLYVSGGEAILKGTVIQVSNLSKATAKVVTKTAVKKPVVTKKATKKPTPKPAPKPAAKKPVAKKPIPKKSTVKKPIAKKPIAQKSVSKKPAPKKPAPKKSAVKKPTDLNAFIKKNYKKMSNKELAVITQLSEHTIRRKLGEWGLKRPGR